MATLRDGFAKVTKDPELLKRAVKMMMDVEYVSQTIASSRSSSSSISLRMSLRNLANT